MSVISLDEWRKKQENNLASKSPSKPNTITEEHGQTLIDDDEGVDGLIAMHLVISHARQKPFTTKSDFARFAANEIAVCAVEGFITTKIKEGMFSNTWMVTEEGLQFMREVEDVLGIGH